MDYAVDQLSDCQAQMLSYWETIRLEIDNLKCDHSAFKTQDLPLARIKKIMKLDDDIKSMMISAEAPILFAKAAELFIRELTLRAWIHTERNRRRTLQRNDISMAVSDGDTDQFDFLIDIVPREESRGHRRPAQASPSSVAGSNASGTSTSNLKAENATASVTFVTTTNGRTSNQVVPVDVSASQPQTLTIALGGGSTSNPNVVGSSAASTVLQQGHTPTIQFATAIPSTGSVMATAQSTVTNSASNTSATVSSASAAAPIHHFQIQLLPQHFQASNADAISGATAGQGGTLLTDANGNTIPVVQVVTQAAGGLALPTIVQESNGQRTQLLQLQNSKVARQ
ncbi:hypothetical protein AHF37_04334 [Paragonimus kellicotti]|nr:hypothetical protein AHF37_04334 [Paragonimus kellicotti]